LNTKKSSSKILQPKAESSGHLLFGKLAAHANGPTGAAKKGLNFGRQDPKKLRLKIC
jgi:hypothetical protein